MSRYYDQWRQYLLDGLRSMALLPPAQINFYSGGIITGSNVKAGGAVGITSTGMSGFSESGSPSEWDMAVGCVWGYRWWKLNVPCEVAGYAPDARITPCPALNWPLFGANGQFWRDGRNEAVCTNMSYTYSRYDFSENIAPFEHEPPEYREPCGCGFWAYFDPDVQAAHVLGGVSGHQAHRTGNAAVIPVLGVVRGTGRVIIGTKGFRSQYAEIAGLCVPAVAKDQLRWDITPVPVRGGFGDRHDDYSFGSSQWYYGAGALGRALHDNLPEPATVITQASDEERLLRYAAVESILSESYPGARVFSDENVLRCYFPPDPNYG